MSERHSRQLPESVGAALRGVSSAGAALWTSVEPRIRQWGAKARTRLRHYLDEGYALDGEAARPAAASITFEGATAIFGDAPALRDISGTFAAGSMSAVVGPNGAGKSTLLKLAAGLLQPRAGMIRREPADPRAIAFLPQRSEIDTAFPITALDFVALGAWRRYGSLATPNDDTRDSARQALAVVGLSDAAMRPIGELSIGNLQRLLFARLLLLDTRCLLLDEPFAAIDQATADDLLAVLRRWHGEGRTIVAVLHDLDQAREAFPECLVLARRVMAWGPTRCVLTEQTLRDARQAMQGN
ncbi:ATP-binding cassette domain-containing protein [Vineibacter terrae]|uniref:ATP-binding cassette domain-containing protein n=1 Tax=Vineibacter terrae TaxID=2586908 RepID=A0A5C8PV09_9HYPH|nr:ATP-binding cassette domain-containing protein [Vineibacter terrae]TXL82148.1 ATP-binding cassette domain-containing protein [Vineibacter terrae]